MGKFERYALLSTLMKRLRAHGSWCGETHVQKAAYLTQEMMRVPLGFDFILYKHGPYSFDLRDEVTAMRADEVVRLQPQNYPYGPTLEPTDVADQIEARAQTVLPRYRDHIEFVAAALGSKGVAELEQLATAYFVAPEEHDDKTVMERADRLRALKPHISPNGAESAVREIDNLIQRAEGLISA